MKSFNLFLFLLILTATITFAQKQPTTKIVKQCNAQLARQLVEQQADFSKSIADNDKRINVLIKVADYLWSLDQESARKYFTEAFQVAQNRFREKGTEPVKSGKMILSRIDFRFEVIRAVAKHDGEWSRKLSNIVLKEFDENKEKDKRDSYDQDREVDELLRLARQVAKDNPNLALTLVRRVMRYPLNRLWFSTLYTIAQNNQSLADQIFAEVLTQNSNAEVFRLLFLSAYPFGQSRIFGVEKQITYEDVPANFSQNPNFKRQFLLTLFKRVMNLTPESTAKSLHTETLEPAVALLALDELEPIISQQFPELLPVYSQARIHARGGAENHFFRRVSENQGLHT
jgi:RNase P subunit RPR2